MEEKIDKRKFNGGKSTVSKKKYDRRKRRSISDNDTFNEFFDSVKDSMACFYEKVYADFLEQNMKHGEYYVYFHYNMDELVYIGKGKNERAISHNRHYDEHSYLIKNNHIEVKIIANNLSEEVALMIEDALIRLNKPRYNIQQTSNN